MSETNTQPSELWLAAAEELDRHLPWGKRLIKIGTGWGGDDRQPLPALDAGVPLYDRLRAWIKTTWGEDKDMPKAGRDAFYLLLGVSRDKPADKDAILQSFAEWFGSNEAQRLPTAEVLKNTPTGTRNSKLNTALALASHILGRDTDHFDLITHLVAKHKYSYDQANELLAGEVVELLREEVSAGQKKGEGDTPPAAKPDGPFDADGFRFAGVEVKFGKASKQYGLVMALWDAKKKRPAAPRPLEDVISAVWGDENETEDSTFRQLCADTRRRFQSANCPIDIKQTNSKVQLTPL